MSSMLSLGDYAVSLENLMIKIVFFIFYFFIGKNNAEFYYFKQIFGHLHQNPSRHSNSLTIISCRRALEILPTATSDAIDWKHVQLGPYKGYILQANIEKKKSRTRCFQDEYSQFFDLLDLKMTDYYLWGSLLDHYIYSQSR